MEKLEKTAAPVSSSRFEAVVFETAKEAADYLLSDMPAGETVGFGGCMTAKQMGLETLLRAAGHKVLWHWEAEPAERPALLHEAMNAPLYVCSANAVTEDGLMVQIAGTGNRIAAMCYGPGTVYVLIGGYAQAVKRIKVVSCPLYARRFQLHNPCAETGRCNPAECEKPMCHVIASFERAPNGKRTQVILINESLGY